jgi:peptide/nickel transport system substrate-binding protein
MGSPSLPTTWCSPGVRGRPGDRRHHAGNYKDIARIDKIDANTVKIGFEPGVLGDLVLRPDGARHPKHVFEPFKGAKSREAPANMKPVGTGPYRCVDFRPNDVVHMS